MKRRKQLEFKSAKYAQLIENALMGEQMTAERSMKELRAAIARASKHNQEEAKFLKQVYRRIRV